MKWLFKTFDIRYGTFFTASMIYICLPVMIFFIFFLKLFWAVTLPLILAAMIWLAAKDVREDQRKISVSCGKVIISVLFVGVWVLFSGIGEFSWVTSDHTVRAATLNDLVQYDWPVFYDLSKQSNPAVREALNGETVAFAYYFTFWLVPALAGKITGSILVARVALLLWSAAGIFLILTGIDMIRERSSFTGLFLFFIFGGFDIIPSVANIINYGSTSWEGWNRELFIHGNFYQTMNVFHQSIPGWLVVCLLLTLRNNRFVGMVSSLIFAYSPWATIGLLPIAVERLLDPSMRDKDRKKDLKNIFGIGNLLVPVIMLAVFATFFTANTGATGMKGFIWEFFPDVLSLTKAYIAYVLVEFGVWAVLLYKENKKDPLFVTTVITLLVFPVYKMTEANDLIMRGTMAPMFVLMIFVILRADKVITRFRGRGKNNDFKALGFFALLFLTACVPYMLFITSAGASKQLWSGEDKTIPEGQRIVSFGDIRDEYFTEVTNRQFYVYDYGDRPFYRIFGKTK
ncbi:MAG TPA: hypothetical protein DCW41_02425 [Clostridiales bacterium]|nr:hypothetical protein [Clostridiales bacterium]